MMNSLIGEMAALLSAALWAAVAVIFKELGKDIRPTEMNLIKGGLASVLLVFTMLLTGISWEAVEFWPMGLLLLSGAIGIGVGDTAYFEALNQLGARRALLLMMLAPPITGITAWAFIGEGLEFLAWIGILLTVAGVAWVITERTPGAQSQESNLIKGVAFGILAAVCQAVGAVMSRAALTQSEINPMQSSFLRLLAGAIVLIIWMVISRESITAWVGTANRKNLWGKIVLAVSVGTYLCVWLQQSAFRYSEAGIAQTLLSTGPLFIIPIAAANGEKITLRAVFGVLLAMAGIVFIFGWKI